jgi:hypothetical protein
MQPLYVTFIFCIVLFLYIHVYAQIKTSNDLEVFEIDNPSKEMLEEICDLKQPVLFNYTNNIISELFSKKNLIKSYSGFDVNIRNVGKPRTYSTDDLLYVALNINDACNLIDANANANANANDDANANNEQLNTINKEKKKLNIPVGDVTIDNDYEKNVAASKRLRLRWRQR